jgi:hypothetical protein
MKTFRQVEGSSSIASYEYNDKKEKLTVEFVGGAKYQYSGVDIDTFYKLNEAESVGKFFAANIRDKFEYEMVGAKGGTANLPKPWKFLKSNESLNETVWPFPKEEKVHGSDVAAAWPFPTSKKP